MSKISRYAQASRVTMRMPETSGALGLGLIRIRTASIPLQYGYCCCCLAIHPTRKGPDPMRCVLISHAGRVAILFVHVPLWRREKDGTDRAAAVWRLKWIPMLARTGDHAADVPGQEAICSFFSSLLFSLRIQSNDIKISANGV